MVDGTGDITVCNDGSPTCDDARRNFGNACYSECASNGRCLTPEKASDKPRCRNGKRTRLFNVLAQKLGRNCCICDISPSRRGSLFSRTSASQRCVRAPTLPPSDIPSDTLKRACGPACAQAGKMSARSSYASRTPKGCGVYQHML